MLRIKWTNRSGYGVAGHVDGKDTFRIYPPGDPCNYTTEGKYQLSYFKGGGWELISRTYHNNLSAAKRAALRLLDKEQGVMRGKSKAVWNKESHRNNDDSYVLSVDGEQVMWVGNYHHGGRGKVFDVEIRWGHRIASGVKGLAAAKRIAEEHYFGYAK